MLSDIFGEYIVNLMIIYLVLINMIPQINNLAGYSLLNAGIVSGAILLLTIGWCATMLEDVGLGLEDDEEEIQEKIKGKGGIKK